MKSLNSRLLLAVACIPGFLSSSAYAQDSSPVYLGVQTCAHCHGTAKWTRMAHYDIWSATDPHSKAYKALENDLSKQIAVWMGLPENQPQSWMKCVRCHASAPAVEGQGPHFTFGEGVSCEACHGPAENWFVPHLQWDASHERNVSLGMKDLKNLEVRARTCLACHSGLDHEIVAAGHPDLSFELFHYSFWQPPHWEYEEASPLAYWAVGQAVALEESLTDLNQALVDPTTGGDLHIEVFDDKACYQCHHKLSYDRWRFVEAHHEALWPLLSAILPEEGRAIEAGVERMSELIDSPDPASQVEILKLADDAASIVAQAVPKLSDIVSRPTFDSGTLSQVLQEIALPVEEPVEAKFPEMDIPHAWMIREFNRAEQKYYALKCLGLSEALGATSQTTAQLLAALEKDSASQPYLKTVDELWTFVDSVFPQERRGGFKPSEFNQALKKIAALTRD